ncbi:glutamyl-tRNA reductase [Candidatus Marinamargulisbacteria bacterium SCGC AAA071-K20]|nr:glutamyl-tRNA reductase [Candidatus Marinamargulisbacteria bacterium SCGC AAA071-K20]
MFVRQCGTSIKRTPVIEMEKIHFGKQAIPDFLDKVKTTNLIQDMVLLMTCNRVEFYYTCEDINAAKTWLYNTISESKNISVEDIKSILIERDENEATQHLFAVTSGLESMVYGENEILTQVKDSYHRSVEFKLTGPLLNKIFQKAVATGKRVRTETEISRGAYSVSSIAIEAIREKMLDYFSRKILVVGAGLMARRALKKLSAMGHPELHICNRSKNKAESLASDMEITVLDYNLLSQKASDYDIIILATSSKNYILDTKNFNADSKTILVLDLGVPRNADPSLSSNCNLVTVDGLKDIAEKNVKKRQGEKDKVLDIIREEIEQVHAWKSYKETQHKIA